MIFPAAGLDPAGAERYYEVLALVDRLSYAGNEAARRYLNGDIDAKARGRLAGAATGFTHVPRAEQRVRFIDQYRSYVINYNLGKDMVARYVDAQGGTDANPARRWTVFERLLSSPRLPSGLAASRRTQGSGQGLVGSGFGRTDAVRLKPDVPTERRTADHLRPTIWDLPLHRTTYRLRPIACRQQA